MKKLFTTIAVLAIVCSTANAQSFLDRLKDRAKEAAEQNISNKVEKGVNDLLDGNFGKKKDKKDKKADESPALPGPARNAVKPATQAISATTAAPRSPLEKPLLPPSPKSRWEPLMQRVTLSRETRFSLRILLKMSSWESSRHSGI